MDNIGTVGNISNVKYCRDATTHLISFSKLGEIGFRVSFEDEEGQVVIRRKSDNAIEYIGIKENKIYWITEKQFLYLAHVDLDRGINKAHLGNSVANFDRDSVARLKIENLVHNAEIFLLNTL